MGTSLAPALATIVVADLEEDYLRKASLKPTTWLRYIDYVLAVWPHSLDEFQDFAQGLNQLAPQIRFTAELLPASVVFLDLRIYKLPDFSARGHFSTSIH